jgi:hypothetical protein
MRNDDFAVFGVRLVEGDHLAWVLAQSHACE